MRKLFNLAFLAVMSLVLLMPMATNAQAQANPMLEQLPTDTAVIVGKLPNGLTYYIRHNEYPKGQADFYIAQNVGSALEEDNQRGLAHFLEHMSFNGTTHFPGSQLRDWLESVGVKFGANLNAYTGVDETVYNISNVPVARESVQDSCLLILHDWANDLTLDPAEIDKERGVIHEEWRRSMQGQMRILEKILPDIYPTTKYGHRLPIGTMEVVDNFPPQALRDYYETWYRPDQQAIIVVGDIDPARIEAKIKEMFADVEMPENAKPRTYEEVPDHQGTLYGIGSDPEQTNLLAEIFFIYDPTEGEMKNTIYYLLQKYVQQMISDMLNNRLNEINSTPDSPFAVGQASYGDFMLTKEKEALTGFVAAKGTDIIDPLKALYRELLRAQRGGFTVGEYERAKNEYLSALDKLYNNRNARENNDYVQEYVGNFTDQEPIPGIETEYPILKQIAMMVPLEMINSVLPQQITADNRAVMILSPEGEGYVLPTKEQLNEAFAAVDAETIEPYVDEMKSEPLISEAPAVGKIVSETTSKEWGTTEWTLSNGVKVIVKPTKFKEDEVLFGAIGKVGFAGFPDSYASTIQFLDISASQSGLGSYTNTDLQKYTAGKQVAIQPDFSAYDTQVTGVTTPKDLPTFMELLYMTFRDINFSAEEFEAMQKSIASLLANQEKNPAFIFEKDLDKALYASPLMQMISVEDVEKASREQTIEVTHKILSNAANFAFEFVGNVDLEALRPLVETYIASLPADAATAVKKPALNPAFFAKAGSGTDTFTTEMATPQTYAAVMSRMGGEYNAKDAAIVNVAGQILSKRLIATVREEMGAVYSISAQGSPSRNSEWTYSIQSTFPMKPEMKQQVLDYIHSQLVDMETNVTDDELNPVKEYMVKSYTENREKNSPWLNGLLGFEMNDVDTFTKNVETMNSITVADVKAFMKRLNAAANYRVVILDPAK